MVGKSVRPTVSARPPGRPRKEIDLGEVADNAARLFDEGGYDAVSIEAVAERMAVSRATLYRTVSTKDQLLAVLFERSTDELDRAATALVRQGRDPSEELFELMRLHIGAAIRTRRHMAIFFGGAGLPPDVLARWQGFSRRYERLWAGAVGRAMRAGLIPKDDPVLTTRLLLGMVIWVARWYRPDEPYTEDDITRIATRLLDQRSP
ncbi:TetR/AcrR family transcriptional regulator [Streptomyces sp. NPDC058001]|uniref:TetR/AcrR family transcriptional regulator n=1 Tax=Streptomyces sp. NPDC058001 TaxID=3346300 RepID=UPI0036E1B2F4